MNSQMALKKGLDIPIAVSPVRSILQQKLLVENTKFNYVYECPTLRVK